MKSPLKLLSLLLLLALASCKEQPKNNNLFKFKDFVQYTTNNVVSVAEPIKIQLAKPVESWGENTEVNADLLEIKPSVAGMLKSENNQKLVFYPEKHLTSDTEYSVTLNLKEIYPEVPKDFAKYTFQFKTISPAFKIDTKQLQSYNKEFQFINAQLQSADVISLVDAKKMVAATQNGKKLTLVWNEATKSARFFEFKIDSIQRFVEESKVKVTWDGTSIKSDNKGENIITIPGKNNFKVLETIVNQGSEQYIGVSFSDPLQQNQNYDGLVTLQNTKNPKFMVDGNLLKIYPSSKLTGTVKLDVRSSVKNEEGYSLKKDYAANVVFQQNKPQVRLLKNGAILPNSKNLSFNFEAVNLSKVDVRIIKIFQDNVLEFLQKNALNSTSGNIRQVGRRVAKETITLVKNNLENTGKWKAYSRDLSNYIKADPGAIYRVELSYKQAYSLYNCSENEGNTSADEDYFDDYYEEDDQTAETDEELREEQYWDNVIYNYQNNNYQWRDRNNPCTSSYFNYKNHIVTQNILSSNLGVLAKKGADNNYFFAVTDLLSTEPVSGAKITLYNYQKQQIAQGKSDGDGFAMIEPENRAAFAIVEKANNYAYIKLFDGNALSLSKFDVSGKQIQKGLKGYVYGERGVWRPGDDIHLTFILNDAANPLPKNHPIKIKVTDPLGKLVFKKSTTENVDKFYTFKIPTETNYKTGNYNAKILVGGATFTKVLKVETIKPNRLKINLQFGEQILSSQKPLNGTLQVNWLHGTPAKNLKTDVKTKFSLKSKPFKGYESYVFSDPTKTFHSQERNLFEGKTDENGTTNLNTALDLGKNAPGMLRASFLVRAFENGGDFSMDAFSKDLAPYASFVGLKSPKAKNYGSFDTDQNHTFSVVTLSDQGQPIIRNNLEVNVYKIEWRWWWNSSYENLASYVSNKFHKPVKSFKIKTDSTGKTSFNLNIPDDEGGRYLIRVTDPVSGHATGRTAYFYKNWWRKSTNEDKEAAKILVASSDKKNYQVGEVAKVTFPSSNEGRALITIENGSEILMHKWIKTAFGETTIDIDISSAMAPNVFVSISLLQPHQVTSNDLPIRLYGVVPLLVENPETKLYPEISMPASIKPNEEYVVKVKEENGSKMTYTLAVVEEGLLDLTRFKTPNAWSQFYAREALGVKTWDVFDDVIGAYAGNIEQVFATGGDDNASKGKNKKANRFKPVVNYLGPFTLKKGKTNKHKITMPNYIGAVRTMVVAGNSVNESYGNAQKSVKVKQPLMVLASLPRKLSPGEKVTLPVTVFAMEEHIRNVDISLKLSDGIKVVGASSKSLLFSKPDEKMAYFDLEVLSATNINTIEVTAKGHGEKANHKVEIEVENPNPITSRVIENELTKNQSRNIEFNTFGEQGSNSATVVFSTLPPMNFTNRLNYLIRYPHGCLEQTTSSVFPQLYMNDIFDLSTTKQQEIEKNIKKAIKKLGNFQRSNGGLSYWASEFTASDWGTSYAGHFMLEAAQKGYVLPLMFKQNWIKYQKAAARKWQPSYAKATNDLAQAYRLYTLALAGEPDLANMNRLRAYKELSNDAKWRLAAAYALAGKPEASKKLYETASINFNDEYSYYNYGSPERNRSMALETMILSDHSETRNLSKIIANSLSSNTWMSTQTTAYSLLAMSKLIEKNGGKALDLAYKFKGKSENIANSKGNSQRKLAIADGLNTLEVINRNDNLVYVSILNSGKLPVGEELAEQRGLSLITTFKDLSGKTIDVANLKQGEDFMANITVTNQKDEAVNDVALTQLFPSGWEIVNTRFTDFGASTKSAARYTEMRDNSVNFYFDLPKKGRYGSKTFTVLLNAAYLGKYYLPGTQAEAMYNNDYFVRNQGKWVSVEQ